MHDDEHVVACILERRVGHSKAAQIGPDVAQLATVDRLEVEPDSRSRSGGR